MKPICKTVQESLAAEGREFLRRDEAARDHVAECESCFPFLESLTTIEEGLRAMPRLDASEAAVEKLFVRLETAANSVTPAAASSIWGRTLVSLRQTIAAHTLAWGGAAAALLLVALGLTIDDFGPQEGLLVAQQDQRVGEEYRRSDVRAPEIELLELQREGAKKEKIVAPTEVGPSTEFSDDLIQDLPAPGRYYQSVPTAALEAQGGDGDEKSRIHGSRPRDFQAIVGGVSNVDPLTGKLGEINRNSIDEVEVVTTGADVDFAAVAGGVASPDAVAHANEELQERRVAGASIGKSRKSDEANEPHWPVESVPPRQEVPSPPPPPPVPRPLTDPAPKPALDATGKTTPLIAGASGVTKPVLIEESAVEPVHPETDPAARLAARVVLQLVVRADGTVDQIETLQCDRPGMGFEEAAAKAVARWRYQPAMLDGRPVAMYITVVVAFDPDATDSSGMQVPDASSREFARALLAERTTIDGLAFVPASGYWSNTYVPGDPALRLLQARLADHDRAPLLRWLPSAPRLHDAARLVSQPFDTPEDSALAVYLHADRRGIDGESRVLLQVGLEGTPRHGGRRPPMNLALVLDLGGEIGADVAVAVRALVDAFNAAQQPGDRFRLFVTGRPGDLVVAPQEFRHGFLKVVLDRAFAGETGDGGTLEVVDGFAGAIREVALADDPGAPLGSNAVILIASRPFGGATRTLADLAHQAAVGGISTSVVGLGSDFDPSELERVTLAGQGSRRVLDAPAAAASLVEAELASASRAIARAVRLRIRLAPGVKLVEVLGSERLDETRAERVRQTERSIDLRLAQTLGIEADRGADEEGIQIVIPAFHAGDSHVILLDVVAPGPGPLAEVTVRYKDLVRSQNGVTRAGIALGRDARPDGPLEHNVLKNLLSVRLSRALDEAGRALRSADGARAATLLAEFARLLEGLRAEVPGLESDADLLRDEAMLGEYGALLSSGAATDVACRDYLADSLRYAALLKVLPRPLETRS